MAAARSGGGGGVAGSSEAWEGVAGPDVGGFVATLCRQLGLDRTTSDCMKVRRPRGPAAVARVVGACAAPVWHLNDHAS
mgnify:CR=1 FL=1